MVDRRSQQRVGGDSRRRRRRPEPPPPPSSANAVKWLAGASTLLVLLIVFARAGSESPPPPPAEAEEESAPPPPRPVRVQPPPPPVAPSPSTGATPTVDLMVRLEAHRRVIRAGAAVYLDSLFADSDSTLRRWPERRGTPLTIAVVLDSLAERAGVSGAAVLRDAFARWGALQLGLQFAFISDTAEANILVEWVQRFEGEDQKTGFTNLTLSGDGVIEHARVQLALEDPAGKRLDRATMLVVAVHEAGHAIGLSHSSSPGDVMYPTPRSAALTDRDRRTAEFIYSLPPGSVKGGP